MESTETTICKAIKSAKESGKARKVLVRSGGRGAYDFPYDPSLEIRVDDEVIVSISDRWSSPTEQNCYSYHTYIRIGPDDEDSSSVLYSYLPQKIRAWLDSLCLIDEADKIAETF
jgi:hypothetical protein